MKRDAPFVRQQLICCVFQHVTKHHSLKRQVDNEFAGGICLLGFIHPQDQIPAAVFRGLDCVNQDICPIHLECAEGFTPSLCCLQRYVQIAGFTHDGALQERAFPPKESIPEFMHPVIRPHFRACGGAKQGKLPAGTPVEVLESRDRAGARWARIRYAESGWMRAEYLIREVK